MLTADDTPTIRLAIQRRLGREPGVAICDIKFGKAAGEIAVGILALVGAEKATIARSRFNLPDPFEIGHLHDEIDEIAEHLKVAARDHFTAALAVSAEHEIAGTGLKGRWARYGLRHV